MQRFEVPKMRWAERFQWLVGGALGAAAIVVAVQLLDAPKRPPINDAPYDLAAACEERLSIRMFTETDVDKRREIEVRQGNFTDAVWMIAETLTAESMACVAADDLYKSKPASDVCSWRAKHIEDIRDGEPVEVIIKALKAGYPGACPDKRRELAALPPF